MYLLNIFSVYLVRKLSQIFVKKVFFFVFWSWQESILSCFIIFKCQGNPWGLGFLSSAIFFRKNLVKTEMSILAKACCFPSRKFWLTMFSLHSTGGMQRKKCLWKCFLSDSAFSPSLILCLGQGFGFPRLNIRDWQQFSSWCQTPLA